MGDPIGFELIGEVVGDSSSKVSASKLLELYTAVIVLFDVVMGNLLRFGVACCCCSCWELIADISNVFSVVPKNYVIFPLIFSNFTLQG